MNKFLKWSVLFSSTGLLVGIGYGAIQAAAEQARHEPPKAGVPVRDTDLLSSQLRIELLLTQLVAMEQVRAGNKEIEGSLVRCHVRAPQSIDCAPPGAPDAN